MGRIRTTLVTRTGRKLFQKHPEKFTTDFNANKLVVGELADVPSKKLRNLLAGYLTKLKRTARQI